MLQFESVFVKQEMIKLKMSVYTDSIIFSSIVIGPNSTIIISASKVIKSLDAEHPLGHLDWISKSVFKVLPQSQKVYK